MTKRTLEIELPEAMWGHIDRLVTAHTSFSTVEDLVTDLLDHVQQGVYRSGAWERDWLEQCVGPEAVEAAYSVDDDPAYQAGHIDRDGNLNR